MAPPHRRARVAFRPPYRTSVLAPTALLALVVAVLGTSASATAAPSLSPAKLHTLRTSGELWATIDVCDPPDQPNVLGVRGSMPGDGRAHDRMFMSFRVQYLDRAHNRWVDLTSGRPSFVPVGGGRASRQDGTSFQITPVAGKPAFTLRGVVQFQWRRGSAVLLSLSRATSAGRQSLAGADPAGFSAASCQIG